jgi:hypothetical protein
VSLRSFLCVALLFAIPALAQQSASPATPPEAVAPKPGSTVSGSAASGSATYKLRIECAPASRASDLIGKHGCVAGRVFRVTTRKTGNSHLYLCPSRSKCSFQAVAFARDRSKVGNLTYLHGKLIAVVGDVVDYRGHPEIVVKNIEQIRVAAGDPSPEFDAAQGRPNSRSEFSGKRTRAW